ncbi:hypothetical protein EDC04DRAFT_2760148 [Pisolithus marmoratus]|nr:hypothetical protein EDC04DRAFT_2760148 [Pisolithus marmoratus]
MPAGNDNLTSRPCFVPVAGVPQGNSPRLASRELLAYLIQITATPSSPSRHRRSGKFVLKVGTSEIRAIQRLQTSYGFPHDQSYDGAGPTSTLQPSIYLIPKSTAPGALGLETPNKATSKFPADVRECGTANLRPAQDGYSENVLLMCWMRGFSNQVLDLKTESLRRENGVSEVKLHSTPYRSVGDQQPPVLLCDHVESAVVFVRGSS